MKNRIVFLLISFSIIFLSVACGNSNTRKDAESGTGSKNESKSSIERPEGETLIYKSDRGWSVQYLPELIDIKEGKDTVRFTYTGECVGDSYIEIRYLPGKNPSQVLSEELKAYDEDEIETRDEGYFYEDFWSYHAVVETSEDDRDVTTDYSAAEFNGGVLLTKHVEGYTDENILEGYMGDVLWGIMDTMKIDNYEPQTEFANVPGIYTKDGATGKDAETITLKPDHSGFIQSADKTKILWGSNSLMKNQSDISYDYELAGKDLKVKMDDQWVTYKKTADLDPADNPYADPDTVAEYKKQIDAYYTDATGKVGRVHKMQAFIMELALHAKMKNPDFKIIPQNSVFLAYVDGQFRNGENLFFTSFIDGWGVEGAVGKASSLDPNPYQRMYVDQAKKGKFVSDTTTVTTREEYDNYLKRIKAWGIIPFPRVGGDLAMELWPGRRFAKNGDYFWVEDPDILGLSDLIDGKRDVNKLSDARNYLYNINGRPYDNWQDWDKEESEFEKGDGDRTRISDSYACGLLVPSEKGKYKPVGEDEDDEVVADAVKEYGDHWDWWWREEGLNEKDGRETWLNALRNSDYDVIIIDSFYNHRSRPENQTPLTKEEVESLKYKPDGGRRQVISYLAIGTAEQNRWYCQDDWIWIDPSNKNSFYSMKSGKVHEIGGSTYFVPFNESKAAKKAGDTSDLPSWLAFDFGDEYPEEAVVQWWHKDWRDIIINGNGKYAHKTTGDKTSSIDRIIEQGFDGVYLDNADSCTDDQWDAFEEYWNNRGGIPVE